MNRRLTFVLPLRAEFVIDATPRKRSRVPVIASVLFVATLIFWRAFQ
jgi:hypothetical protein